MMALRCEHGDGAGDTVIALEENDIKYLVLANGRLRIPAGQSLGIPHDIIIVYGTTHKDVIDEIRAATGADLAPGPYNHLLSGN